MSETQHTPTPWKGEFVGRCNSMPEYRIVATDNSVPNIGAVYGRPQSTANAAFIVRACNAHDELVEALEQCITDEGAACLAHDRKDWMIRRLNAITTTARAVLAKLEKEGT